METLKKTYEIPEANIKKLEDKFAAMRRKAFHLCGKLPPPEFTITGWKEQHDSDNIRVTRIAMITVSGASTHIAGYELLAVINHLEDGANIINTVPNSVAPENDSLTAQYGDAAPSCDFCHTARTRNDTFLIREQATGNIRQVGRNCLQYFFPGEDPDAVAARLEWLIELDEFLTDLSEFHGDGRAVVERFLVTEVLVVAANIIRRFGYVSKAIAEEQQRNSTTEIVRAALTESDRQKREEFRAGISRSDELTAETVLAWVREELSPRNDYEWNLHKLCALNSAEYRHLGYVISAVQAYLRHLEQKQKEEIRRQYNDSLRGSQHVGSVGEMTNFAGCKVIFHKLIESEEWGASHLYKLLTEDGNLLVTFSRSEEFVKSVNVNDTVNIRAKIKKHTEYEGVQQTEISHIKVIDEQYARTGKKTPSAVRKSSGKRYAPLSEEDAAALVRYENLAAVPVDVELGF